ncbi:hypothetical protein GGF50DRAFT_52363, partial [Schizophyllum commune]
MSSSSSKRRPRWVHGLLHPRSFGLFSRSRSPNRKRFSASTPLHEASTSTEPPTIPGQADSATSPVPSPTASANLQDVQLVSASPPAVSPALSADDAPFVASSPGVVLEAVPANSANAQSNILRSIPPSAASISLNDLPGPQAASSKDAQTLSDPLAALWHEAIARYENDTGIDLRAEGGVRLESDIAIQRYLDEHQQKFDSFLDGGAARLRRALTPVVAALGPLCEIVGEGVGLVYEPGKIVFSAVGELCKAAVEVCEELDAISDAFDAMAHHLRVLKPVAARDVLKDEVLREASVKLLAQILVVLGVIQKVRKQGRLVLWLKKLAKSTEVTSALADLSRLASHHHETVTAVTLYTAKETVALLTESDAWNKEAQGVTRASLAKITKVAQDIHIMLREDAALSRDERNANRMILENIQVMLLQQVNEVNIDKKTVDLEKIYTWFQYPDSSIKMNNLLDNRTSSTGSWFLDGDEFAAFKKGVTRSLWLHGKAGCGKSTLIAAAIRDLRATAAISDDSLVLTHLFDTTGSNPRNSRAFLASLLCQLACEIPECAAHLHKLRSRASVGHAQISLEEMRHTLDGVLKTTGLHVFIVVDALDEADDHAIILFLSHLLTHTNVSLLMSSRYEVTFRADLQALADASVSMTVDRVTGDIQTLLSALLTEGGSLGKVKETDLVHNTLTAGANGNFRWTVLQVRELIDVAGIPAQVRKRLKMLPSTLGEIYDQLLASVHAAARDDVRLLLTWMILTVRPLSTDDFAELLAFDYSERMPVYDASLRPSADLVLALVGSTFVSVHDEEVRIAHASVKDHMLALPPSSPFYIDRNQAHCLMARTGLAYVGHAETPAYGYPSHLAWTWVVYTSKADTDYRAELEQDAASITEKVGNPADVLAGPLQTAADLGY